MQVAFAQFNVHPESLYNAFSYRFSSITKEKGSKKQIKAQKVDKIDKTESKFEPDEIKILESL